MAELARPFLGGDPDARAPRGDDADGEVEPRERRHYSTRYDPVDVYVTARTIGVPRAMALHNLPRRTVYNAMERVETDDALFALATERRSKMSDDLDASLSALRATALRALEARIAGGKVTARVLVDLVRMGATERDGGGPQTTLTLPVVLARPRPDTSASKAPDDTAPA